MIFYYRNSIAFFIIALSMPLYGQFMGGDADGYSSGVVGSPVNDQSIYCQGSDADGYSAEGSGVTTQFDQTFYCNGGESDGHGTESSGITVQVDQTFYCSGGAGDGYQMLTSGIIIQNDQTFYCSGGVGDGFAKHSFSNSLNEQLFYCNGGDADGSTLFSSGISSANDASIYCSGGQGSGYDFEIFNSTINIQSFYCFGGLQDGYGLEELQTTINDQNLYCFGSEGDGYSSNHVSGYTYGQPSFCFGGNADGHSYEIYMGSIFGSTIFCLGGEGDGYNMEISIPSILGIGIWNGLTNSDWNTNTNWSHSTVPIATDNVTIPSGCPNYPDVNANLGVNYQYASISCNSLDILENASFNHSGYLYVRGNMFVAGDYTNTINTDYSQRIFSGGILTIESSGFVKMGNQNSGTGITDLLINVNGHVLINGGSLEVDDQVEIRGGGTLNMIDGALFVHKYGLGSTLSVDDPCNLCIQSGSSGSISGGFIKIAGRSSVGDFHALTILEPAFEFSGTSTVQFELGISATAYNPSIYTVDGVSLQNLTINKAGNTVFVKSDLNIKGELKIQSGSSLEVENGHQITVGQ